MNPSTPSVDRARERISATPSVLAITIALGIAFDLAFNGQLPGAGSALFFALTAVLIRRWLPDGLERDLLLVAAVVFAAFTVVRASVPLAFLNIVCVSALLGLAATRSDTSMLRTRTEGFIRRALHVVGSAVRVPAALLVPVARGAGLIGFARARRFLRAVLIVGPILLIFAALLASADRVFGDLVVPVLPDVDLSGAVSHVAVTIFGALAVGTLWLSTRQPQPGPLFEGAPDLPRVRPAEWAAALAGIDALFAAFVGVQFIYLFGGERSIRITEGLTYAEYARSGFFQLLMVAALTVLVILGGWDLGRRTEPRQERLFRGLVTLMVVLTGVILASAVMRLTLYQGEFGWTIARLAGYAALAWIGLVLLILFGAIWTGARDRVIALSLIAGLVIAFGVNVIDPARFVAQRNVARFEQTADLDVVYLGSRLGPDAVPVAVDALGMLPRREAAQLRALLCLRAAELADAPSGWRSANLARASARRAFTDAGIEPCPLS